VAKSSVLVQAVPADTRNGSWVIRDIAADGFAKPYASEGYASPFLVESMSIAQVLLTERLTACAIVSNASSIASSSFGALPPGTKNVLRTMQP